MLVDHRETGELFIATPRIEQSMPYSYFTQDSLLPIHLTRRAGGAKIQTMVKLSEWSSLPYTPNPQALALVKELDICL